MRRVVVTGMGCINSVATNIPEFKQALIDGVDGVKEISIFGTTNYRTNHAAQLSDESFEKACKRYGIDKNQSRIRSLAAIACKEAVEHSKIDFSSIDPQRAGISIATSLGGIDSIDKFFMNQNAGNKSDYNLYLDNCATLGGIIAKEYNLNGPFITISTACASGTNSIGTALDMIRYDRADVMICGGADPISRISVNGFNALKSLSPSARVRSFSKERDGLIIGEGAAILVLEDLEFAQKRGATILAEVLGYGIANDAYHMTSPEPHGGGAIRAMKNCMEDAKLNPSDVQYINAHGTGTSFNDSMEMKAIQSVFGDYVDNLSVSSIKGMVGHTLGAAGSVEVVATLLSIAENFLPPTINFGTPIEGYEQYDFVPDKSREASIGYALSNSYAFAGNTASIALGRYTGR